jgi:hypothetical protein
MGIQYAPSHRKGANIMKKIQIALILGAAIDISAPAQVPTLVPGWPYLSRTNDWVEIATTRFGYDAGEPHLFYNTLTGEVDKFLMDGSFFQGWPVVSDTTVYDCTPIIVDIDHDGHNEIVTVADRVDSSQRYLYSLIYVYDDNGVVMPGWPFRIQKPTLNVADLDGDNEYEIICYSNNDDYIICLDRNGNPKPGWPIFFHLPGVEEGYKFHQGIIGDLDLDGMNEFILSGAWDIFAFKFDGSMLPGFHINLQDTAFVFYNAWQPPALADLDLDGSLEIMTSGNNWSVHNPTNFTSFVAIYDHLGNMEDGWPLILQGGKMITGAITPADINNDGIPEIGIKWGDDRIRNLTFVELNGDTLPGWPSTEDIWPNDDLIIVDVNGDGNCEIFTDFNAVYSDEMGFYSWFFGLDYMGQSLPGYPIRVRALYMGLPPTFFLNSADNRLYMGLSEELWWPDFVDTIYLELYRFPDSTGPPDQWPMKAHDNLMTRNYNFVDRVTSVGDEGRASLPKSAILSQNYPNPFNASTKISFILPKEERITLSLYDITGRKAATIAEGTYPAGNHSLKLDMKDYASGIYYLRLDTDNAHITRKMVMVK